MGARLTPVAHNFLKILANFVLKAVLSASLKMSPVFRPHRASVAGRVVLTRAVSALTQDAFSLTKTALFLIQARFALIKT